MVKYKDAIEWAAENDEMIDRGSATYLICHLWNKPVPKVTEDIEKMAGELDALNNGNC